MDYVLLFVLLSSLFEVVESYLQQAPTLRGMIERLYGYYSRSIFLFFLAHPSFYFMIFVVLVTDRLNLPMIFILSFKIFDMFYKLDLIKRLYKTLDIPLEIQQMLDIKLPPMMAYMGVVLYPVMLYMALI